MNADKKFTTFCRHMSTKGFCDMMASGACTFAHSVDQLRPLLCKWDTGCHNQHCTRFHTGQTKSEYMELNNMTFNPPAPPAPRPAEEKKAEFRFVIRRDEEDDEDDEDDEEEVDDEKKEGVKVEVCAATASTSSSSSSSSTNKKKHRGPSVRLSDVPIDPNWRPTFPKISPEHLDHVGAAIKNQEMLQELYLEENPDIAEYNEIEQMHEVLAYRAWEIEMQFQQENAKFWNLVDESAWTNAYMDMFAGPEHLLNEQMTDFELENPLYEEDDEEGTVYYPLPENK